MTGPAHRLLALLVALIAFPHAGHAAMSQWAESDGGRMRLVVLSQPRNDTITALLEIEPKPGWKTYWRNPGDAGMPPELDFSASGNLVLRAVDFPVPEFGQDEGGRFIGYHRAVSLVLTFDKPVADSGSTLNLNALIGICEKICLPFQASFTVPLNAAVPEGEEFLKVQMAEAALPEKPSEDFAVRAASLSSDRKFVEAEITLPSDHQPEIAAVAPRGIGFGRIEVIPGNRRTARVRIAVTRIAENFPGGMLTLLVRSGTRSMESTLAIK